MKRTSVEWVASLLLAALSGGSSVEAETTTQGQSSIIESPSVAASHHARNLSKFTSEEAPIVSQSKSLEAIPADASSPISDKEQLSYYDRFIQKIFESSDLNHNGFLDRNEAYVMALRLYVLINRKAPIPPPSRIIVYQLFEWCDLNQDGQLTIVEFSELATLLTERAVTRVAAFQTIKWLGAPLITQLIIHYWKKSRQGASSPSWLSATVTTLVPNPKYAAMIKTETVARTVLLLMSVMCCGKLVLGLVDRVLAEWFKVQKSRRPHVNQQPTTSTKGSDDLFACFQEDDFTPAEMAQAALDNGRRYYDSALDNGRRYYDSARRTLSTKLNDIDDRYLDRLKRRVKQHAEQLADRLGKEPNNSQNKKTKPIKYRKMDRLARSILFR